MQNSKRKTITEKQWKHAADAYELGTKIGRQLAAELGVSPSTVSRELKRRGCIKGCRVAETQVGLEKQLQEKARRRAVIESVREKAALERSAVIDELMDDLVKTLIAADKAGTLAQAAPKIQEIGKALNVKPPRY